jgi:tetratricopeptide (TPR) repeat protein
MNPILQLFDFPQTDCNLDQDLPNQGYLDVWNFLADYDPLHGSRHLERVKHLLQALESLINLHDIDRAEKLLRLELNGQNSHWLMIPENNLQFHAQVHNWGYSRKAIAIYQQLCDHPQSQHRSLWHLNMGYCYRNLADYPQAQQSFKLALALAEQADPANRLPLTLSCQAALMSAYGSQGDFERTIAFGEQALQQPWPTQPSAADLRSLHSSLAIAYAYRYEQQRDLADAEQADRYFALALAAAQGNTLAESLELGRSINWEMIKGNFDRAIEQGEKFLGLNLDNPIEKSAALGNLGAAHGERGQQRLVAGEESLGKEDIAQSIDYLSRSLAIAEDIQEISNQIWLNCNLAEGHLLLGQLELAQARTMQAQSLMPQVADRRLASCLQELQQKLEAHN